MPTPPRADSAPTRSLRFARDLHARGRFVEAERYYRETLTAEPNRAEALHHLGVLQAQRGDYRSAVSLIIRAAGLDPSDAAIPCNLGNALRNSGRFEDAIVAYDRALKLDPDFAGLEGTKLLTKLAICDWTHIAKERAQLAAHIAAGKPAADPVAFLAADAGPREQLLCAQRYAAAHYPEEAPLADRRPYRHDKIRIGYIAGAFRDSAAALFENHDRTAFALYAFATGENPDPLRGRIEAGADRFSDVSHQSDRAIAEAIRAAEIDILVCLDGYPNGRIGVFAHRPSPVQLHYPGFPGTLGAPYIDYMLADSVVIPKDHRAHYAEKIVTLPDCFSILGNAQAVTSAPPRAALGLPQHGFVFCCFHDAHGITPETFAVWMRLLAQAPNSVLWLLDGGDAVRRNLAGEAAERGVAPERLIFAPASPDNHRARLAAADLFLDTLPVHARLASDALAVGVPVLTCPGKSFAGRIGASLNHAAGLDEMVAGSLGDYEALALKFAHKPLLLAAIRRKLAARHRSHPVFDTAKQTRNIEAAYRAMWERAGRGEPPASFAIGADTRA